MWILYSTEPPTHIFTDGTYVYLASSTNGLRAYTFNGNDFAMDDTEE